MSDTGWDAVVLAGGTARRMGGMDKLALDVGGRSMLDRVVDAVRGAGRAVVVGPQRDVSRPVIWCREEPVGSGPAAALAAALPQVVADVVVVAAGDQPLLTAELLAHLRDRVGECGAVAVDASGAPQWLCSAWRRQVLLDVSWEAAGSLKAALSSLPWTPVPVDDDAVFDCDTEQDLRRARELAG